MSRRPLDAQVLVAGAGPAGWAAAAACARRGLATVLVAPAPEAPWPATYAAWVDQLGAPDTVTLLGGNGDGAPDPFAQRWPAVTLVTPARGSRTLRRAYGRLDNRRVHTTLRAVVSAGGGDVVAGEVCGSAPDPDGVTVALASGRTLRAAVVIDATGWPGGLTARSTPPPATSWQIAHGVVARFDRPPIEPNTCTLMDWRSVPDTGAGLAAPPSFLYAMDLGDGTFLVEETVLSTRRLPADIVLAERLMRRIAAAGTPAAEIVSVERARIAMGPPLPPRQRVVAFGAAAGLGQPATGYSVAASLGAAPRVADAIAQAIGRRSTASGLAEAARRALWPIGRRRVRALERFGLGALTAMGAGELGAFFDAFFMLDVGAWSTYLDGDDSCRRTFALMHDVWVGAPPAVRRCLAAGDWRALGGLLG